MRKFFQKPSQLVPNAARQLLNQKLPDAPNPDCIKCTTSIPDVRPFHIEPSSPGAFRITCLAKCPHCNAPHIGFRSVGVDGRSSRFLIQGFELYSPAEHGTILEKVGQQIEKKRQKFDEIQARPVVEATIEQ